MLRAGLFVFIVAHQTALATPLENDFDLSVFVEIFLEFDIWLLDRKRICQQEGYTSKFDNQPGRFGFRFHRKSCATPNPLVRLAEKP